MNLADGPGPRRVLVIGTPGAGKSTLTCRLGPLLGLPVHHLDRLYWRPGWQQPPGAEWLDLQEELTAGECWIIDGTYASSLYVRLERADTVIFLDFGRFWSLAGVLRRWMRHRGTQRPDMADGCPERFDAQFLSYVWTFPRRQRPTILLHLGRRPEGCTIIRLPSPRAVRGFTREVVGGVHGSLVR